MLWTGFIHYTLDTTHLLVNQSTYPEIVTNATLANQISQIYTEVMIVSYLTFLFIYIFPSFISGLCVSLGVIPPIYFHCCWLVLHQLGNFWVCHLNMHMCQLFWFRSLDLICKIKADYIVPCVMPTHFFVKPLLGAHISETVVANAIKSKLL